MGGMHQALLMVGTTSSSSAQGWNPSDKYADIVLSGTNNVIAGLAGGGAGEWRGVRGVTARGAVNGKYFFTIGFNSYLDNSFISGIADAGASLSNRVSSEKRGINNWSSNSRLSDSGSLSNTTLPIWDGTKRYALAYNSTTGDGWHGILDGGSITWLNSGDPVAETTPSFNLGANRVMYPHTDINGGTTCSVQYYGTTAENAAWLPSGYGGWEG